MLFTNENVFKIVFKIDLQESSCSGLCRSSTSSPSAFQCSSTFELVKFACCGSVYVRLKTIYDTAQATSKNETILKSVY